MNEEKRSEYNFDKSINDFIHKVDSLWTTLPLLIKTINESFQDAVKKRSKFLREKCEFVPQENHFLITPDNRRKHQVLLRIENNSKTANKIIKWNFIVSLMSQFDSYIGSMIKSLYYLKPELLNESDKILTFSELVQFSDIEEASEFIIEKEIESILRKSHTDHFKWFENKLKTTLRKDLDVWPKFIELTERRNLYVHNDGKISSQYVKICQENNFEFENIPVVGTELKSDLDYFDSSFNCLFELAVKLNQVIRRKLNPNDIVEADKSLINITFELIENEQLKLAQNLLDFDAKYIKKHSSEDISCRLLLNRAQTYKWLGDDENCKEIVKSKDWSASNDIFKLASEVLLENFESAADTYPLK